MAKNLIANGEMASNVNMYVLYMITYDEIIHILNQSCGIIPIIKNENDTEDIQFDYPILEVLHRSENTDKVLGKLLSNTDKQPIISVGTILSFDDVLMCKKRGVSIVFSPHFDKRLIQYCREQGITMIPGVSTATDIMSAYNIGITVMKFFPCHSIDKINELKQYSQVFKHLDIYFIATGGITEDNYKDILSIPHVIAIGSSSIKNMN